MTKTTFLLYGSHCLSAWGDRMWMFAVGLFLIELSPGNLRLTASYGFASGGAILFLGAVVGDWVDKSHRLKVARTSIAVQNASLCVSAVLTAVVITYREQLAHFWSGMEMLCLVLIIATAVIADVAGVARTISVERDWIVVICKGDDTKLTEMSALLRRIDLCTNILAPVATGQIISLTSTSVAALVIAGWNLLSLVIEYSLLYKIYMSLPALQYKKDPRGLPSEADLITKPPLVQHSFSWNVMYGANASSQSIDETTESLLGDSTKRHRGYKATMSRTISDKLGVLSESGHDYSEEVEVTFNDSTSSVSLPWHKKVLHPFYTLVRGWRIYMTQDIRLAGLSLGFLYMTVLGFDSITVGYAKGEGIPEWLVGVLMGVSAIFGIFGTFVYPIMRNRMGLSKTGTIAFTSCLICLLPCIVSIFVVGSPFEPGFLWDNLDNLEVINGTYFDDVTAFASSTDSGVVDGWSAYLSVGMLMGGIVIYRAGLWAADLTVTQLLLEKPDHTQRGIVNGVQNSINKLSDIMKFLVVIFLPWPETFGYLVLISYAAIVIAAIMYYVYASKRWGK